MSRHKDRANLYATEADRPDLAEKFSKAAFKGTTLDLKAYEQAQAQAPTQADNATSPQAYSVGNGQQSASGQMPTTQEKGPASPAAAGPASGPSIGATVAAAVEAGLKIGRQAQAESTQRNAETALKNAAHNQEIDKWVKTQTKQNSAEIDR